MKNEFRMYVKVLQGKAVEMVEKHKKKLIKAGAIILAVITVAGSVLIVFKTKKGPEINHKPARIVEVKDENNNTHKLFLEHVEQLKSGIYDVTALVFGEENMRMNETYGESGKNYVVVQGDFKIKYSIDIQRIKLDYDFDKEEVILKVPKDAIGVSSVELMGDIKEIERFESIGNKIMDIFPWLNENEQIKEGAIRQLLRNSKVEANKYNMNEMQNKADKALKELVNKINLNDLKYSIEFVDNTRINIKK
jgi:hypothetical protein